MITSHPSQSRTDETIQFDDLAKLQRSLKTVDAATSKQLRAAMKAIGKEVAVTAKGFAPKGKTGKLGSMISPSVTNNSVAIVSNVKRKTNNYGQKRSSKHPSKYPNPY